jgi:hypothetical protein
MLQYLVTTGLKTIKGIYSPELFFQVHREVKLIPGENFADIWDDNRLDILAPFVRFTFAFGDDAVSLFWRVPTLSHTTTCIKLCFRDITKLHF